MNFKNIEDLKDSMEKFNNLYDFVRIVDPLNKETVEIMDKCESSDIECYEAWKNDNFCKNCISQRAILEDDTFVKIEYDKDKICMVMASPVVVGDKKYAMELLKDVTYTGIITDVKGKTIEEINEIINKLNMEVITDELTGVYNRRYLYERLPVDILKAKKNDSYLSIIMFDFDDFKQINDNYGHLAGNAALKNICEIINLNIRKEQDYIVRFGGDEFLIVLPNVDKINAYKIAEKIINNIANKEIEFEGKKFKVTVSMGVYTLNSEDNIEMVLDKVDKMMYKAKICGKNCVL